MPAAALPRIVAVEVGALGRAARQGRLRATLRGKLEGLRPPAGRAPRAPPPRRERRPHPRPRLARPPTGCVRTSCVS